MRVRFWILALALSVVASGAANAQVQSGSISGTVGDAQGGVLPGVTITMTGRRAHTDVRHRTRPGSTAF